MGSTSFLNGSFQSKDQFRFLWNVVMYVVFMECLMLFLWMVFCYLYCMAIFLAGRK